MTQAKENHFDPGVRGAKGSIQPRFHRARGYFFENSCADVASGFCRSHGRAHPKPCGCAQAHHVGRCHENVTIDRKLGEKQTRKIRVRGATRHAAQHWGEPSGEAGRPEARNADQMLAATHFTSTVLSA
jgi:hypothetical protein